MTTEELIMVFGSLVLSSIPICGFIVWIGTRGSKHDNAILARLFGFVPGFNILLTVASLADIISRARRNKACTFGHKFERVFEGAKPSPLRAPVGGYERWLCTRCFAKETVKWSAF